ncbi:MAG TPA: tryptophan--tRNA ligase, partial [Jatrophihabitantaceae bacterium]
ITHEPARRPDVARLLTLAALCSGRTPEAVADEAGDGGGAALKAITIEAVDALLAPIRERREAIGDADVRRVLERGTGTATAIADDTLREVRTAMGMDVVVL